MRGILPLSQYGRPIDRRLRRSFGLAASCAPNMRASSHRDCDDEDYERIALSPPDLSPSPFSTTKTATFTNTSCGQGLVDLDPAAPDLSGQPWLEPGWPTKSAAGLASSP